DLPPSMSKDDQNEHHPKSRRRHREEVHRYKVADVVVQECSPRLRRWLPPSRHPSGDSPLRDVDSKFRKFSSPPRSPPQRIRFRHPPYQLPDLPISSRSAGTIVGEPPPVRCET